jgi:23S rRNA (cytosine1962-C5)-methyltransferase
LDVLVIPCLIFEDDHLLVVNKPAGLNTHAPSPYAGEGLYDWLRHRERRWAELAIVHRLDKETSGVIVFPKTPLASRSLTQQFATRTVRKKYLLLTDRAVPPVEVKVKSCLVRVGEKYVSRPIHAGGQMAETLFRPAVSADIPHSALRTLHWKVLEAEPLTGRTHQIRVHAGERGFPILGDTLYGGTQASRVHLHAAQLTFRHPATGQPSTFRAAIDFADDPRLLLRHSLLSPEQTNAYRVIHGASDGWPDWHVDRLGDYFLSLSEAAQTKAQDDELASLMGRLGARGAYHKTLQRKVRQLRPVEVRPEPILGGAAPERFIIRENTVKYELSFEEGYSIGLFLDQRENRRRLLTSYIAAGFPSVRAANTSTALGSPSLSLLNTFAYTCGFSVCAAKAGMRTTNLDLSKKYLEWGKRNFLLNGLDPSTHEFIYGDAFDWFKRLARKKRLFDVILLDPPTFSQSKESGAFRVEKDYGKLVAAVLPLLRPGGLLFASTNAAGWAAEDFLATVELAIQGAKRRTVQRHYVPQPPDFPISRAEPAYLKTVWCRVD